MAHKYKIKEESADPKKSVIVKSNVDVEFTIDQLDSNERDYKKMVTQLTAQKKLADAKMKNIEDNHPFVMDLTEEQCFTVHMYQEARAMSRVCGQKLPEYESEVAYIAEEKKEIENQIGIAIPAASLEEPATPHPDQPASNGKETHPNEEA